MVNLSYSLDLKSRGYLPSDHVEVGLEFCFDLFLVVKHDLLVTIVVALLEHGPPLLPEVQLQGADAAHNLALVKDLDDGLVGQDGTRAALDRRLELDLDLVHKLWSGTYRNGGLP